MISSLSPSCFIIKMTHDSELIHLMVFPCLITQLHIYILFIKQFIHIHTHTIYVYTYLEGNSFTWYHRLFTLFIPQILIQHLVDTVWGTWELSASKNDRYLSAFTELYSCWSKVIQTLKEIKCRVYLRMLNCMDQRKCL